MIQSMELNKDEIDDVIHKHGKQFFGTDNPEKFKNMMSNATTTFLPRMTFDVKNVGNNLGIIFPRAIARMLKLEAGLDIEVTILTILPRPKKEDKNKEKESK